MAGFSEATADSRIRKYESDAMALKAAIRQRIADALEVDLSALSDIDISTNEDVIHALFQLEESFGLEIEKKDGKTYFNFKDDNSEMQTLNTFMNIWSDQKKVLLPDPQNDTEEQMKAYERWKARFFGNT